MTSRSEGGERSRWLLEPPAAGELQLHIAVGEGMELSLQLKAALDQLVAALYQDEVVGYVGACSPRCPDLQACGYLICGGLGGCDLTKKPCLADVQCRITFA